MITANSVERSSPSTSPVVSWATRADLAESEPHASNPRASFLGAVVALAICVAIGIHGALEASAGWLAAVMGLPGAVLGGWYLAPRVVKASRWGAIRAAGWLAVVAVVIGDAVTSVVIAASIVAGSLADPVDSSAGPATPLLVFGTIPLAFMLFVVGLVVSGFALVIAFPAALVWAVIVRRLAGRGWAR